MRNGRSTLAWGAPLLGLLVCCTTVSDDGRAWTQAERLNDDDQGSAVWPRVALDANGNGFAVWDGGSLDSRPGIWSKQYRPGSGWDALEKLSLGPLSDAYIPELAANPNGSAVTVWGEGNTGARRTIWSNRFHPDGGWETAERLDPADEADAVDPDVAMDPEGNAISVWHQSDGEHENIWANRSTPGDGWGTAELIESEDLGNAGDPRVAADGVGNAVAVWHQSDGTRTTIWANRYNWSSDWGAAQRIDDSDEGDARLPQVAMDPDGNAMVVWHQSGGSYLEIWSCRFTPSGGWGTPERIDGDDTGDADSPKVGMDAVGHAIAVWKQFDGITVDIWSNRYVPGVGWAGAERIETNDEGDALPPRLAVSTNGDAVAVWPQSDGVRYDVWSNVYTPEKGWEVARPVDPSNQGPGQAVQADVAIDPSGNALAIWWRGDPPFHGVARQVWTARFE